MTQIQPQPTLVEQVVNAIISEIVDGDLPSNARLIQDELAVAYVRLPPTGAAGPTPSARPRFGSRGSRPGPDRLTIGRRFCPQSL